MGMEKYDPPSPISYLSLVRDSVPLFSQSRSIDELIGKVGRQRLTDITDAPEQQRMEMGDPLPFDYRRRVYQFADPDIGRGVYEPTFNLNELVNLRMQVFFQGAFSGAKAKKYLRQVVLPLLEAQFGGSTSGPAGSKLFKSADFVAVARKVPLVGSVSIAFTRHGYL